MTRSKFSLIVIVFVGVLIFFGDRLPGMKHESKSVMPICDAVDIKPPCVLMALPAAEPEKRQRPVVLNWDHMITGRLQTEVGDKVFVGEIYSQINKDGKEWDSLACVPAGRGLEVEGRWDQDHWYLELNDSKHMFPKYVRVPADKKDDSAFLHEFPRVFSPTGR